MNALSKQKRAMHCGMKKPHKFIVRLYASCLIVINDYLDDFLGENSSDNIGETEINKILLNIIPNGWSEQA